MVIYGLLRLQNAEVGLIPSKKFEFWGDHHHLEKVRALKILLRFRALFGPGWIIPENSPRAQKPKTDRLTVLSPLAN